jgi:two-component system, OmpR family, heavy metal sensor histidine kinase CusS
MSSSPAQPGGRPKEPRSFVAEASSLLAHDLNNQLALMLANLEFLDESLRDRSDLDPEIMDTVSISQASLQHMMILVRNMTDISRMEDPGLVPAPVATDVARLVRGVAREHRPLHDRGAVQLRVECADLLRADVDPLLVKRVVHNLLANARRFVDKGGAVRVAAALEPSAGGQVLVLSVGNTGPVIPPERRDTLFDKYRVNPDGRLARGMGLYFCRLACEAHGGGISLSEDSEFPTVFTARIACGPRAESTS